MAGRLLLPRRDPIESLPLLVLFPHARCNCRCVMCDIWKATGRDQLSPDEVRAWSGEWVRLGTRRVVLSGGEPLLNARFTELCVALRESGIGITLLSTGLLLEREAETVARLVDDVIVSLDGPREVHDAIRRVSHAFERLADGVRALRAAAPALPVSARSTVQRANARHLRATVAAAMEIGLDGISFLAADVSPGAFGRGPAWSEADAGDVSLGPDDLAALAAEIDALERECAADLASGFVAESAARLRARVLGHFAARAGEGDFAPLTCNAPWVSAVVEADGTVRPCFFHAPYGNLRTAGSLGALVNSPAALAFRASLDVATDPVCRRCVCNLNLREGEADAHPARRGREREAPAGEPEAGAPKGEARRAP
ncbi:MAG: radical SAM protein [Thermoanaerobaculia bacterium]